ncbi:vesicle-trafficking protein SEC22a-like [Branchiostoma floridae]|uniref:Vesicle-trafficking protein SEC22a-like n=1 Tax=Branchiostoma floridae TaxID=7739 RepID=A0A9J7N443_BRAFL|nr:vesicle-trafficking protein SEC22a-like [Branchiostoma floridae]
MVISATIYRWRDGLPLSASTDFDPSPDLQNCKKTAKIMSKKLNQFPDRCVAKMDGYCIYFISSPTVTYLTLCHHDYPAVLAFCFLDELQKEFITTYDPEKVEKAVRPFSFIEFDNSIQKTKQRYNNPRTLTTRMNLTAMSQEVKLRPPHHIHPSDLGPIVPETPPQQNHVHRQNGPRRRLMPIGWLGFLSLVLNILCGALNLARGIHIINDVDNFSDYDNYAIANFWIACGLCFIQCYLLLFNMVWRNIAACVSCVGVFLCNLQLMELRNMYQIAFHVAVSVFAVSQIMLRKTREKPPDYNV